MPIATTFAERIRKQLQSLVVVSSIVLPALAASSQAEPSEAPRPLTVHDAIHINRIYDSPALSSDGRWLAYSSYDSGNLINHPVLGYVSAPISLTIVDLHTNRQIQLGNVGTFNVFPLWSPNSRWLAYISDRDGEWGLWIWDSVTGKSTRKSNSTLYPLWPAQYGRNLVWTLNSQGIVTRLRTTTHLEQSSTIKSSQEINVEILVNHAPSNKQPSGIKSSIRRFSDTTKQHAFDLAVIDLASGNVQVLAKDVAGFGDMSISPNGSHLAYVEAEIDDKAVLRAIQTYDLKVIALAGGKPRTIARNTKMEITQTARWSPDGTQLAFSTSASAALILDGEGAYVASTLKESEPILLASGVFSDVQWAAGGESLLLVGDAHPASTTPGLLQDASRSVGSSLWRLTLKTRELEEVTPPQWERRIQHLQCSSNRNTFWSPDGGRSVIIHTRNEARFRDGFWRVNLLSKEMNLLTEDERRYLPSEISANGTAFIYSAEDSRYSEDLWLSSGDLRQPARRVTRLNPQLEQYAFGESRLVQYRSSGKGEELLGALFLPRAHATGKPYPLITVIYPLGHSVGPDKLNRFASQYPSAEPTAQLFTTRGYAVLYPAAPTYMKTPMRDMANAILPAIDRVIDLGIADPDRLGITGHSYGGYSTIALVTQSSRFKAAIMNAGAGNLLGLGLSMPFGDSPSTWVLGQGMMGASVWEGRSQYIENNPILYLDRILTPLLILHGKRDNTVSYWLADEVFAGLKLLNREVEYRLYTDAGHMLYKEDDVVDALNAMLRWFEKYL